MFKLMIAAALLGAAALTQAQTCRWDGTAPFCSGECRAGESESFRAGDLPQHWKDANPVVQNTNFGAACLTGTKVLCCPTPPGNECRWDGTAPFCAGRCGSGERQSQPPPGSTSGNPCLTGSKVFCCRSNLGQSRQGLSTNRKLTYYAAVWDKTGGPPWQARHGLSSAAYQQFFDRMVAEGYRPAAVRGYAVGGQATYAALFEKRPGPAFVARHGIDGRAYQQEFDRWTRQGYRPVDVSGFTVGGADRYTVIYEKAAGPAFRAFHGITSQRYQTEFDAAMRDGFRPVRVSGYTINGVDHYAAIFVQRSGPAFAARHGLTSAQYQQAFDQLGRDGFKLTHISSWQSGGQGRYAALWEKSEGVVWQARHNMLSDTYQEEFTALAKGGYRLRDVSAYHAYD
jgi:hypothetical protein